MAAYYADPTRSKAQREAVRKAMAGKPKSKEAIAKGLATKRIKRAVYNSGGAATGGGVSSPFPGAVRSRIGGIPDFGAPSEFQIPKIKVDCWGLCGDYKWLADTPGVEKVRWVCQDCEKRGVEASDEAFQGDLGTGKS